MQTQMKAILYNKKHAPTKLQYSDVELPTISDNELLIKVVCSSINAADYRSYKMKMIPKSKIFGSAVSGTVEKIGANVQQFKVGDQVLGDLSDFGFSGFAEYAKTVEKAIVIKPDSVSFADAAALPVAATTALKALRDKGQIKAEQKVLIVGASGGVGTYAIQLAKHFEADVTAVCSSNNIEQSLALGANEVIDYKQEHFLKKAERYDLIIAINGNYSLLGYKRILNPTGIYVMVGGSLGQIIKSILFGWLLSFGKKKMKTLSAKSDPKDLEFVAQLLAEDKIKSVIECNYPLENTAEAMKFISEGHASGKVIIDMI